MKKQFLNAIRRLLPRSCSVVTSHPLPAGETWVILRGDESRYWFEVFPTEEDAKIASRLVVDALSMGAGYVDAEVITLTAPEAAAVKDLTTYKAVISKHPRVVCLPERRHQ